MNYDKLYEHQEWRDQLPPVLCPQEVMDILGVGKNTVYRMLDSGQLRGFRIGNRWKIPGDAVEALLR